MNCQESCIANGDLYSGVTHAPHHAFSRRQVIKGAAGLAGALALSQIPYVGAAYTLQIPKLSYTPSVNELIADYSLQQQMLSLDDRVSDNAPVTAKTGIGFDDIKTDFIIANTSQTSMPQVGAMNIAVDKTHGGVVNENIFYLKRSFDGNTNYTWIRKGTPSGWASDYSNVPDGFETSISLTKSYFSPDKACLTFSARIPNSYMGPGGQGGQYGIFTFTSVGDSNIGPEFPADGSTFDPSTYGSFITRYPIPEFSVSPNLLALGAISVVPFLIAWRAKRMKTL
jgi:hypothetical protein